MGMIMGHLNISVFLEKFRFNIKSIKYRFNLNFPAIITNFHLPKSTLLVLVSAFAGREHILAAYQEAVRERYRFFSFGDAMFILPRIPRA